MAGNRPVASCNSPLGVPHSEPILVPDYSRDGLPALLKTAPGYCRKYYDNHVILLVVSGRVHRRITGAGSRPASPNRILGGSGTPSTSQTGKALPQQAPPLKGRRYGLSSTGRRVARTSWQVAARNSSPSRPLGQLAGCSKLVRARKTRC